MKLFYILLISYSVFMIGVHYERLSSIHNAYEVYRKTEEKIDKELAKSPIVPKDKKDDVYAALYSSGLNFGYNVGMLRCSQMVYLSYEEAK